MRIGAGLDIRLGLGFDGLRQAGREAARLGFESVWTPALGVPDAFHVCAAWAEDTPLVTGISVVPAARMWGPLALAWQAATVGEISRGRFVLGIGTGGYGPDFWASVGLPDRPIAVMRDYLTIVRGLLAGETVTHEGPALRVQGASLGVRDLPRVPVYLGALGPQMLRLAGEQADGALLNWATPARIAESRRLVAEGAARAGRDPGGRAADHVHPGLRRRRRGRGAPGAGRPGADVRHGQARSAADGGLPRAVRRHGVRRGPVLARGQAAAGEPMRALVDAAPDELFSSVGYFGPAGGAASAYARLAEGLDETVVRIVTARPGMEPVVAALEALTPDRIRAAGG